MSQPGGSQWRRRYAQRATTWRERQARQVVWAGGIDWDPAGPYGPGIDGASYAPGWIEDGRAMPAGAVLLIKTRAITELIRGWDSYGQMQEWLASRGTTGSGRLVAPPAARRARCVAEETVLSHMLGHAEHVTAIGAYLPPWTWTSDVRHDLAAAMLAVGGTGRRHGFAGHVAGALEDRAAAIPAAQLRAYGGRGAPLGAAVPGATGRDPGSRRGGSYRCDGVAAGGRSGHCAQCPPALRSRAAPGCRRCCPAPAGGCRR